MNYTQDEIVAYARAQIRFREQAKGKRLILGFLGLAVIVNCVLVIQMIKTKADQLGVAWLQDAGFLTGFGLGVLACLFVGAAAVCLVRLFPAMYGQDIEVYRLLVRLTADSKS